MNQIDNQDITDGFERIRIAQDRQARGHNQERALWLVMIVAAIVGTIWYDDVRTDWVNMHNNKTQGGLNK